MRCVLVSTVIVRAPRSVVSVCTTVSLSASTLATVTVPLPPAGDEAQMRVRIERGGVHALAAVDGRDDFAVGGIHHDHLRVAAADDQAVQGRIDRQPGGRRAPARSASVATTLCSFMSMTAISFLFSMFT